MTPESVGLATAVALPLLLLAFLHCRRVHTSPSPYRRSKPSGTDGHPRRGRPKPAWVRREVIRLKALQPHDGCRLITASFNRNHRRRKMTVGKSYVHKVLTSSLPEVAEARREIRRRPPRRVPKRLIWAADLTFVDRQPVLGVIDHGTRLCLSLTQLRTKASVALLRCLLDTIDKFGRPTCLRTDNEVVFTSWRFRCALRWLGIRHQRTEVASPWQNGRIERFFGTFKSRLRQRTRPLGAGSGAQGALNQFRFWYNHLRPHDNLGGTTPAEAWAGKQPSGRGRFLALWDGVLSGFYVPR